VATNDCHYLLPTDHFAHDVLVCIQTGKTVHAHDRIQYSPQHYLKSRAEMAERFAWAPEALANSNAIAQRCGFAFEKQPHHLPNFPVPDGYDLDGYFEAMAREGFAARTPRWRVEADAGRLRHPLSVYEERLTREIRMIREMGFAGYFLIVWDFIRFSREQGIPVGPGRGSAAGSLVAYCMRITDIDPMQFDLLFERFLNPERVSLPDIDIDFCFRKRERVIDYVTEKYGRPNVAQIITFGTMAARAVLRDAGRGLDIPYAEVDKIAKLVPQQPGQDITIAKALEEVPALKQAYQSDPQVRQLIDVGQRLEGLVRHASTHAAGVVIAPKPIVEFAPLYRGTDDAITTQFAMSDIEEIGLLKMDFLGLKTLTLIDDAVVSIAGATGQAVDLDTLTLDDPDVYELFAKARTAGIFQFESEGMKNILRRLKPDRFEDLVAINALYRPGPIGGGLIDDFIKRRHGKIKVEYPHPLLEDILRETYGVIVYQEQVMQIASAMAGYSLGEADILRRAMGKKKKEVMAAEREKFIDRSGSQRKIKASDAGKVFDLMEYFAGYGFNKSHSAAYALVAYRTAWLKAHHPVHFMAALLTTEKGNTDKLVHYINACREMGIPVLPPDVNVSSLDFTVDGDRVRFGLSAIKNVGEGAILSILEARRRLGRPLSSLFELAAEIDLRLANKRVLEALVQSGAADTLGGRRSCNFAAVDAALEWGGKRRTDRESGQGSLFLGGGGGGDGADVPAAALPDLPDWDQRTRLAHEKATLGFYVSGHPLESLKELLAEFATHTTDGLRELPSGTEVAVGGMVADFKKRKSKKGAWWGSFQLEDLAGQLEVLAFPKAFEASQALLQNDRAVLVTGRVESEEGRVRLTADAVASLDDLREKNADGVQVRLDAAEIDDDLMARLRTVASAHRGEVALYLEIVRSRDFRVVARAEPALRVLPSRALLADLEGVVGPGRVRLRAKPQVRRPVAS
jgi:DNA polymerase-3 subunit alpha